jgi:hypothetical protein
MVALAESVPIQDHAEKRTLPVLDAPRRRK